MAVLNYSSFMQLIKEHYSYDIDKEDLARGLLCEITDSSIHYKFTSSALSYIWNGERNITSEIKNESEKIASKKKCLKWFEDVIFPEISEHLKEDFFSKLETLIRCDETISNAKKDNLLAQCVEGNYPQYLSNVFLYALKKNNKSFVTRIGIDDVELLQQVNQECPLCKMPLIEKKATNTFYRYSVTKIFPDVTTFFDEAEFNKVHTKPSDLDDASNKICLCDTCSSNYLFTPTLKTYDILYRIKWVSLHHTGLRRTADKYPVEEKITEILSNIKKTNIDSDSFKLFKMKPLKIKEKINPDNKPLIKAINDDNDAYYFYIKDYLSTQDEFRNQFMKIALEVQLCFTSLLEQTDDQDEIYNALIQWLLDSQHLTNTYRTAAHIVISFFVQNCEVFNEISE